MRLAGPRKPLPGKVVNKIPTIHHLVATKFAALRHEIFSPTLSFLMEAQSGLSARIVEAAGFRGLWASGPTLSASPGLRDSNEASCTRVLEVLEYMADATSPPMLADGDTGHGNFNNVRIAPGSLARLGRPTIGPADVARRFKAFLADSR
jgi:2-methylisocitrate lyase-like PEP mutase family enzyme